jgi:hypothetical protein
METGSRLSGLFRQKEDFENWVLTWCDEGMVSDSYRWELFVSFQDILTEQETATRLAAEKYMRERALLDEMQKTRHSLIDFYRKSAEFKNKFGPKT